MGSKPVTECRRTLGDNLRRLRESRGVSLRQLGLMTGVYYQYISRIEKGDANPTVDVLDKLATALNATVRDLF